MNALVVYFCLFSFSLGTSVGEVTEFYSKDSFNEHIPSEEFTWVVMFYVPWCGRCTGILPIWDEVADHYKENNNLRFGKVDCSVHHSLCGRQLIGKYPTFTYYKEGNRVKMISRDRTLENFINWIDSDPQPEVIEELPVIEKESQVVNITKENEEIIQSGIWMVAFCAPWGVFCEKLGNEWKELSTIAYGFQVAMVNIVEQKEIAKSYNVSSVPTIKMLYKGEIIDYINQGRSVKTYETFVKKILDEKNPKPPIELPEGICRISTNVVELNYGNFDRITNGKDFFIEFYAPWCNFCAEVEPILDELADDTKYHVGKVDAITYEELRFKYLVAGYPTLILKKADGSIVRFRGDRTVKNFAQFLDGELDPETKQSNEEITDEIINEEILSEEEVNEEQEIEEIGNTNEIII